MANNRSTTMINSALGKHVKRFTNADHSYSPQSVKQGLEKIHGHQTTIKGAAIATFNATHASNNLVCPVMHGNFVPETDKGYAKNLHMGTTRIWNADGTINEERWKQFVDFVTRGQKEDKKIVTLSGLKKYLAECYEYDAPDPNSGRNAFSLFSSKYVQGKAATAAWDEVFDRLACGWHRNQNGELEPYINLDLVREFFEDSEAAFQKAEDCELPVSKPCPIQVFRPVGG